MNDKGIIRKTIEIDFETKTTLSHQAIENGMNLKRYIERILKRVAEAKEDEYLVSLASVDEGIIEGKEKEDFLKYLNSL
jgi:hypothetical protein